MMRRVAIVLWLMALAACSTKLLTREKSSTPQLGERDASSQADPDPPDGDSLIEPFESGPPFDAGCPADMPEAGAGCAEWRGAYDCLYEEDGSTSRCDCKVIPETEWWACHD